jgi:LuxR family maltose regulon positive regulatory protein
VLAVGFIGTLMSGGEFEGVADRLRDAERWLEPTGDGAGPWAPPEGTVVLDERELARLPGVIEMYRAALALVHGDPPATIEHAQRAISRAAAEDDLTRAGASALLGLAFWGGGDLEAAHRAYAVAAEGLGRVGYIADVLGCSITLADIRITQGRLSEALRTYERALRLAANEDGVVRGTADIHVGLSQIARERDDLPAALRHLRRAEALGEHTWLPQNPYRWRVAMARVREAEGDLDGALDLLEEAERVYTGDFSPNARPIPALRARVLAAQGRVGEALGWARERGLSADDDLSYLREFEHITLARVLLAQYGAQPAGSAGDAARLLRRLLEAAEAGERTGSVIEILALQALADQARGDVPGALAALERALTLAEPEGYVRMFAAEGPPMASLLRRLARQRATWDDVRRLLSSCGRVAGTAPVGQAAPASQRLVEPLSERELDVLRLLASDLDGPDIARELTVSLNTLRTHTKSIYAKLGVNSRRAAVRQAAELNLLSRARDR